MEKKKKELEDVVEITRGIVHGYFSGTLEPYFDALAPDIVYVGGPATLYGRDAVVKYLSGLNGTSDIISDEYRLVQLARNAAIVFADVLTSAPETDVRAISRYTFVYKLIGNRTRLVYQHSSFNFIGEPAQDGASTIGGGPYALIRLLLLRQPNESEKKIAFHASGKTILVDSSSIVCLHGTGKRVEVACVDRAFITNATLNELEAMLPPGFLRVHRSHIVNSNFVSAVRRCEVELVTGEKIPVPAASYTRIRRELMTAMGK